jgi:UDP-N-acetylmuramoylalanine--D-glutamate ligase
VIAIVGGQRKKVSWDDCAQTLATTCRSVYCVGESGPVLAEALARHAGPACATVGKARDLAEAVRVAFSHSQQGDVVLFSPGAPSFDAYANYTERGDHFRRVVEEL